jgi:hypothetical protein
MANMKRKIAVIPTSKLYQNNLLFKSSSRINDLTASAKIFNYLKKDFDVNTYDSYDDLGLVDIFIFERLDLEILDLIYNKFNKRNLILISWEPPVVSKLYSEKNLIRISKYFKFVFTWNDYLVNEDKFKKFNYPEATDIGFVEIKLSDFKVKKLLTQISSNLNSNHSNELYSLRKKLNIYFSNILSINEFVFYGVGWELNDNLNYGGVIDNKILLLSDFKFTICFENMKNVDGYISEKIFDAFYAGVVPIYYGAANIDSYIPRSAFIDYRDFSSNHELISYIRSMAFDEWSEYIRSAQDFICSDAAKPFTIDHFASAITEVIQLFDYDLQENWRFFDLNLFFLGRLFGLIRKVKTIIRPILKVKKNR